MTKYKTEEYGGRKVVFIKGKNGYVFAQSPSVTKQYIGVGKTKEIAFNEAKKVIDSFNVVSKVAEKNSVCKYEDLDEMAEGEHEEEYRLKGKVLRIYRDNSNSESPREWSNLGIMACSHRNYNLGDEQLPMNLDGWDGVKEYLIEEKGAIPEFILPLYLYDHSGITMRTTPFGDRWDSGQVGFIYATEATIKEIGAPRNTILKQLKQEVKTYDQYLTGDVYGFRVYECVKGNWEETDAVWRFFGSDVKENGILDNVDGKGWRKV